LYEYRDEWICVFGLGDGFWVADAEESGDDGAESDCPVHYEAVDDGAGNDGGCVFDFFAHLIDT